MKLQIQGKSKDFANINEAVDFLMKLSKPFGYGTNDFDTTERDGILEDIAKKYFQDWITCSQPYFLFKSIIFFEEAIIQYKKSSNKYLEIKNTFRLSIVLLYYDDIYQSYQYFEKAALSSIKNRFIDLLHHYTRTNYYALFEKYMNDKFSKEQKDLIKQYLNYIEHLAFQYNYWDNNLEINKNIYRVAQGEIGVTTNKFIGTDNINTCVALFARNKEGLVALAHIDHATKPASLDLILELLEYGKQIDVHLIGAIYYKISCPTLRHSIGKMKSDITLRMTLEFISKYNMNILSAMICDPNQPKAIAVNSKTFMIFPAITKDACIFAYISNAYLQISREYKKLKISFDHRFSDERLPILLNRREVESLRTIFLEKDYIQTIQHFMMNCTNLKEHNIASYIQPIICCTHYYKESIQEIMTTILKIIEEFNTIGFKIDSETKDTITNLIYHCPIYIGSNSSIGNLPLISFIKENLFTMKEDKLYIDVQGLETFEFPNQFERNIAKEIAATRANASNYISH